MRAATRTLASAITVAAALALLPHAPAAQAAPVVQLEIAPLPTGVPPGVEFPVSVTATPSAGASLKSLRISAVNCSTTVDSPLLTSALITCPALLKDALVSVYATDTLGGVGKASSRITFSTAPAAMGLTLTRAGSACSPVATLEATATTAAGEPISGVPVVFKLTPPAGSSAKPILAPKKTGPTGTATYGASTRPDWAAEVSTVGVGPWQSASGSPLSITQDACTVSLDLTSPIPSRVPINERLTLAGTVSALRADGEAGPLRGASVSIRQAISTTTPPSTKVLTTVTTAADGSWTAFAKPLDSGPLTAFVSASPKEVTPATASFDLGSVTTVQYIAGIEATASPVAAPLLAGARANVTGRVSATNPVSGDPAVVPSGVPLEVYFTSAGSTGLVLAGRGSTRAGGSFTIAAKARSNGTFTVKMPNGTRAYAAAPATVPVSVTGRLTLGGMTTSAGTGRYVSASVSVNPKRRTPEVVIEARTTGDWTTLATVGTGLVRFKAPSAPGKYEVRARHAGDALAGAATSGPLPLTVTSAPPVVAPDGLDCASQAGRLPTCTWTAPEGATPSSYRVYQAGKTLVGETSAPTLTISGTYAKPGVVAQVTVKAIVAGKETEASPPDAYTVLATPRGLSQSARTTTSATLKWSPVAGAAGYDVSVNGGTAEQVEDPTFTVQGVDPGSSVTVTVVAFSETDDTSAAASINLTTDNQTAGSPPANLSCQSANSSQLVCTWVAVPGAIGYRVYRSGVLVSSNISAEYPYPAPIAGLVKSTGATLTGLAVGDALTLAVTAVSLTRESMYSNVVNAAVTAPPQRLTAPVPAVSSLDGTTNGVQLAWPQVGNAVAYDVTVAGKGTTRVYTNSAKITGLTPGSVTTATVTAIAAAGYVNSQAPTIRLRPDVGAAPASLSCTSPSPGAVTCQWAAVPGATGYALYKDGVQVGSVTANAHWPAAAGGVVQSTGVAGNSLAYGATHQFTVRAILSGSTGDASDPVTVTIASPPLPALTAPIPYLDAAGGTTATVAWQSVPGADSYRVSVTGQAQTTVTSPTVTFNGLAPGVVYTVTVYATGASSSNSPSAQLRIRSDATDTASALTCGSYSVGSVNCQFSAGIDATSYQILKDGVAMTSGVSAQSPFPAASSGKFKSTTVTFSATAGSSPVIRVLTYGADGAALSASVSVPVTVLASTPVLQAPVPYVSEATGTGFTLTWEAVPNATSYLVTIVGGTTVTVGTSSATITGLTPGTVYQVYVRAQASGYTSSPQAGLRVNPSAGAL